MSAYESLKPWEQQVVDYYVANAHTPNATKAVRAVRPEAKRPDVMATKLMKRPEIAKAIEERMQRRRETIELDEKWVLDRLRTIVERCMQVEPVMSRGEQTFTQTEDGELALAYTFDAAGANKALELIGKHFAMFTDRIEAEVEHRDITDEPLTDEQWAQQYATH